MDIEGCPNCDNKAVGYCDIAPHLPDFKPGWRLDCWPGDLGGGGDGSEEGYISYCPFCGFKLPEKITE